MLIEAIKNYLLQKREAEKQTEPKSRYEHTQTLTRFQVYDEILHTINIMEEAQK